MVFIHLESFFGRLLAAVRLDALLRKLQTRKVPILMYHSIVPDSADPSTCMSLAGMTLSESRFREHMAYVAAHYQTITLSEYVSARNDGGRLPPNPCILTFDDGFRDFLELARPVLKQHGLTAVVFVIGSTLDGGGRGLWLHNLYAILDGSPYRDSSRAMARTVPDYPASEIHDKATLREWAGTHFRQMGPQARERLLDRLASDLTLNGHRRLRFLDEAEIRALAEDGFEIGAHSMHHEFLANLTEDGLEEEVVGSGRAIESVLGARPASFSYPFGGFGSWNDSTVTTLRGAGFSCAVSTVEGLNSARTPLFALRRVRVTGDVPASVLVFRMLGLRSFRWKLRGLVHTLSERSSR
jgi:peptidoglycan/xylan/chitin deacetylase (PgdA/CDA1 family)